MNNWKKINIIAIIVLILTLNVIFVSAEKRITLLAVEEDSPDSEGSTASLSLKTVPGRNDVYLDTFPLTKLDTQISLRFAKDSGCKFVGGCKNKDFLYKLRADSSIIGGPSAGAAGTILTIAELLNLEIDPKASITGTINSGNFVGPVGGVKAKIEAAANSGLEKVLISRGSEEFKEENSTSINLIKHGEELGVEVIPIDTIEEALVHMTNYKHIEKESNLSLTPKYLTQMKKISDEMCERKNELEKELKVQDLNITDVAQNFTSRSEQAINNENYYSAASFCFRTNIEYREELYKTIDDIEFNNTLSSLENIQLENKVYNSPNNLQVYLILSDRLKDLKETLEKSKLEKSEGNEEGARDLLAFARERAFSISVWSTLFTEDNDKINYDLRTSCIARIGEANERLQYAKLFAPVILAPAEEILGEGISHMEKQEYPECLSKAIEVKVRSNTLLTALGITNEQLPELVSKKLRVAEREIISQEYFPILAYSYYEYSKSLKDSDPGSALLYSEYALEMTNMESYLSIINGNGKTIDNIENEIINNSENIRLIITGLLIGLLIGSSFAFSKIQKKKNDL